MTTWLPDHPHIPTEPGAIDGVRWAASYLRRLAHNCPGTVTGENRALAYKGASTQLSMEADDAERARSKGRAHDSPREVLDAEAECERIDDA